MNTTDRIMTSTAIVLAAVLATQVFRSHGPEKVFAASWAEHPATLDETVTSAEHVVLGRVTSVRRGQDIVVAAPGFPDGEDRIPIEIIAIRVEKSHKGPERGGPPETIEIMRTGASSGRDQITTLEDPPYARGEQHLLFVKPGPEVVVGGERLRVHRLVSPEGRYRVRGGTIEPAARHGFAAAQRGRSLEAFERDVTRSVERGARGRQ